MNGRHIKTLMFLASVLPAACASCARLADTEARDARPNASCRSMAQTMAMGQAAGVAAALSLDQDCGARDVRIATLQDRLLALGAVLELPDEVATEALCSHDAV